MAFDTDIDVDVIRQRLDYEPETGIFRWRRRDVSTFATMGAARSWNSKYAGRVAGCANAGTGYIRIVIDGRPALAHRIAMTLALGRHPAGEIDHINGNRSDNRIENLRVVTATENRRNISMPKRNTSGVVGVGERRGRWRATIKGNEGRQIDLGMFETKQEAAAARKGAEKVLGYHPNHGRRPA